MDTRRTRSALVLGLALAALGAAVASDSIVLASFSSARPGTPLPAGWEPLIFLDARNHTTYSLVEDNGATVLKAESHDARAGITRRVRADPLEYPRLSWRWKVANVLQKSRIGTREGDDYPARVYVMFDYPAAKLSVGDRVKLAIATAIYGVEAPTATLCYVWDTKAPVGTIATSAYTDRVRLIVAESGPAHVNQWVRVERDVAADFRAAFGEEAPAIMAIAIATDTDNTGESAIAWYGDIVLARGAAAGRDTSAGAATR